MDQGAKKMHLDESLFEMDDDNMESVDSFIDRCIDYISNYSDFIGNATKPVNDDFIEDLAYGIPGKYGFDEDMNEIINTATNKTAIIAINLLKENRYLYTNWDKYSKIAKGILDNESSNIKEGFDEDGFIDNEYDMALFDLAYNDAQDGADPEDLENTWDETDFKETLANWDITYNTDKEYEEILNTYLSHLETAKEDLDSRYGFDEEDFDALMDNNIMMGKSRPLFSMGKLIKMAGNSIVVNVLEAIFMQVDEINKKILGE